MHHYCLLSVIIGKHFHSMNHPTTTVTRIVFSRLDLTFAFLIQPRASEFQTYRQAICIVVSIV